MKKLALLVFAVFLISSCAPGSQENAFSVTAALSDNSPAGEIVPGANVELMKFSLKTNKDVSVGNIRITWQKIQEQADVNVQHFRLLKQDTLLDATRETMAYGEPTIFLEGSPVHLTGETITNFSVRGDVAGKGIFKLIVIISIEVPYSSSGETATIDLPLTGNLLEVSGPSYNQSRISVEELQIQIDSLLAQLSVLQEELTEIQSTKEEKQAQINALLTQLASLREQLESKTNFY